MLRKLTPTFVFSCLTLAAVFSGGIPLPDSYAPSAHAQDSAATNTYYFPRLNLSRRWQTSLKVTNLEEKRIGVRLTAYGADGSRLRVIPTAHVDPFETLTVNLKALPQAAETLEVASGGSILSSVIFKSVDGKKSEVISASRASRQIDFPTLVPHDHASQRISLLNPNAKPTNVTVIAFDQNGYEVGRNASLEISAMESKTFALKDVFAGNVEQSVSNVRAVADEGIAGQQLIDGQSGDLVGLPGLTTHSNNWRFPVLNGPSEGLKLETTIGLVNPGGAPASVQIEAFNGDNDLVGVVGGLVLLPASSYSFSSPEMKDVTHLRVSADQPLAGYEVIKLSDGPGLAAALGIPEEESRIKGLEVVGADDGSFLEAHQLATGDGRVRPPENGSGGSGWRSSMLLRDAGGTPQSAALSVPDISPSLAVPGAPTNLVATILNGSTRALYWHDNSSVEGGFKIERRLGAGAWTQIAAKGANSASFSNNFFVDVLSTTQAVYYRLRAYNASGHSGYSNEALASAPATSTGFDFPVGDAGGKGTYRRNDNGLNCATTIGGNYWYVAFDVTDPNYPDHTGEDWNGTCGGDTDRHQPVYAASAGRVVYAGYIPASWGNVVVLAHRLPAGTIVYTQYAHLERILVSPGVPVNRRQQIGTIGKGTGTYSAHLHFEVRRSTVAAGSWPVSQTTIRSQYHDPTDRNNDRWSASGFIEANRNYSPFEGHLDVADCTRIAGWAWNRTAPNAAVYVDIYDGPTFLARVLANQFRVDLRDKGYGNGYHGFSYASPPSVRDGASHQISVRYVGADGHLGGTPKTVTSCACAYLVGQGSGGSELSAFQSAYNTGGGHGALGCPKSAVQTDGFTSFAGVFSHYQPFVKGDVEYHVNGARAGRAFAVVNPIFNKWATFGFTPANPLGYPIDFISAPANSCYSVMNRYQSFEGGSLSYHLSGPRAGAVFAVYGAIHEKWGRKGYAGCPLGMPVSDESDAHPSGATGRQGRLNAFEGGHIYWIRGAGEAFEVHGAIYTTYSALGGSASWLGFPTSDEFRASSGYARSNFEGGYITTTDGVNYRAFRY